MNTILTQNEYQNQFVDFYRQTLGTGISSTVPIDEDEQQDDGSTRRANIQNIVGSDDFNPAGIPSYNINAIDASSYARRNEKSAKANIDKSFSGFTEYAEAQLKRPETIPLGIAGIASGLPIAGAALIAGPLNRKQQYKAAIEIASAGAGNMMELNGQVISRRPGSTIYNGTLGDVTSEQAYALEQLSKGYIPGTMVETYSGSDDDDGDGAYSTTGKTGLLDAATAQRLGGNYDAYGNWHSTKYGTVSRSGPIEAANAYAKQMGIDTTQPNFNAVTFSNNWKTEASKGRSVFDSYKDSTIEDYNIQKSKTNDYVKNYSLPSDDGGDESQPDETLGGTIFDTSGEVKTGGTPTPDGGFEPDESPGENTNQDSYESEAYGGGFSGFSNGGRIEMQEGGVAAEPGFVKGPPQQFSDKETIADDQNMKVKNGTFVINAPAVEFAGSEDIRKMILDAYTLAQEKGLDIGRVDRKIYESSIDVALSKGEVVIPPQLAKIIGYDKLEKINNRGKKEVSRRQEASGGGFLGLNNGGGVFSQAFGQPRAIPQVTSPQGFLGFMQKPEYSPDMSRDDDVFFGYKVSDIKKAIRNVEIKGFENQPYIYTGVRPKKGKSSSAFGPMQITASSLQDVVTRNKEYKSLDESTKSYIDSLILQGKDKINIDLKNAIFRDGKRQPTSKELKDKFGRYGMGVIPIDAHKRHYDIAADLVLRQKLLDHKTLSKALSSYGEGEEYAKKVLKGLQ